MNRITNMDIRPGNSCESFCGEQIANSCGRLLRNTAYSFCFGQKCGVGWERRWGLFFSLLFFAGCQTAEPQRDQEDPRRMVVEPERSPSEREQNTLPHATASQVDFPNQNSVFLVAGIETPDSPLNKERVFGFLQQICDLGPRVTGSQSMQAQQKMLVEHFNRLGGKVRLQRFRFPHPENRSPQEGTNMIVEWHPQKKDRILICVHYDTRPQGDNARVPKNQRGDLFLGANDGGSGVALLMELAYKMPELQSHYGVDFLLVDAEEFVFSDTPPQRYFWGSEFFARDYRDNPPPHRYLKGVVLDMIGDRHLQIYQDRNSVWWRDTRPITQEIWKMAEKLGVKEFHSRTHPKMRTPIRDDHLMLRNVGKIPTCEIIDFDYPKFPVNRYWHTSEDTPERCSGDSMAKVGWVILEWLRQAN